MATATKNKYKDLAASISRGEINNLYFFYGQERYLLQHYTNKLKELVCDKNFESFNYRRLSNADMTIDKLENAIETLPFFSDKTFIEVHDFDIFKSKFKERLHLVLKNLPSYVCIVFVFNTVEYKPDSKQKLDKEMVNFAYTVNFEVQKQSDLESGIRRRFHDAGKRISGDDAQYLAYISGGLMTNIIGEINKISSFVSHDTISRSDIDEVVTPVLDAVAYKLTDAIINRNFKSALNILDSLLQMRQEPHMLLSMISKKMRQLLTARICLEHNLPKSRLMQLCQIKHEYPAEILLRTAKKASVGLCADYVMHCGVCAMKLNTTTDKNARLIELISLFSYNM